MNVVSTLEKKNIKREIKLQKIMIKVFQTISKKMWVLFLL